MAKQEQARKRYLSDLTDEQWGILPPLLPPPRTQHGGAPRQVDLRAVLDTLLYQNRTGCQWDMLPHDLLPETEERESPVPAAFFAKCKKKKGENCGTQGKLWLESMP